MRLKGKQFQCKSLEIKRNWKFPFDSHAILYYVCLFSSFHAFWRHARSICVIFFCGLLFVHCSLVFVRMLMYRRLYSYVTCMKRILFPTARNLSLLPDNSTNVGSCVLAEWIFVCVCVWVIVAFSNPYITLKCTNTHASIQIGKQLNRNIKAIPNK